VLARYCDFLVRYSEILFDPRLTEVTSTHLGGEFPQYTLAGAPVSCWAEPQTVWPIIRECSGKTMIGLVNLMGNADDLWNEAKAEPIPRNGLSLRAVAQRPVRKVWWASPDDDCGRPRELPYDIRADADGMWLHVAVPTLRIFGLLVIESE
jgi:dextranase